MINLTPEMNEVRDWTIRKGWRGEGAPSRTVGEECALLHSEVSEALEALRSVGLARWIDTDRGPETVDANSLDYGKFKPEGVPSEIADVLIRLLDNYAERGLEVNFHGDVARDLVRHTLNNSNMFEKLDRVPPGDLLSIVHLYISLMFQDMNELQSSPQRWGTQDWFNGLTWLLFRVSDLMGFNLMEEYSAKMQYNETRARRHGGKRL